MFIADANKMYRVLKINRDTKEEITISICIDKEVAEDIVNYYETISSNFDYDIRKISVDVTECLFRPLENIFDLKE